MTNWTRFFPMLLAAHLHLGAMCTASASSEDEPADRSRAPAFSVLVFMCLLIGAVFVSPALGDDRPGPGGVKGVLKSVNSGQPLPGANVAVRRPTDSTLVGGTTTDSTGHFVIEDLPTAEYTVVASFVEYESSSRQVALTASDLNVRPPSALGVYGPDARSHGFGRTPVCHHIRKQKGVQFRKDILEREGHPRTAS